MNQFGVYFHYWCTYNRTFFALTVTTWTNWRWWTSVARLGSSVLATSPIFPTTFGTSAVKGPYGNSKSPFFSFFLLLRSPLTNIAQGLKDLHEGRIVVPLGKKKQTTPKKKSARRWEILFESTEKVTAHTVPLMAVQLQRQTESRRAETLAWVSTLPLSLNACCWAFFLGQLHWWKLSI